MEPATVNRYLSDIKAVLSYATRKNEIPTQTRLPLSHSK